MHDKRIANSSSEYSLFVSHQEIASNFGSKYIRGHTTSAGKWTRMRELIKKVNFQALFLAQNVLFNFMLVPFVYTEYGGGYCIGIVCESKILPYWVFFVSS